MRIIDKTEKRSSIVDLVNPIVEQAFGRGFKGNYDHEHLSTVDGPEGLKEVNRLCMVGRKRLLSCRYAGQFEGSRGKEPNGSVIAVFPDYESAAKKYAELYEQRTKKKVKIILTDLINPALSDLEELEHMRRFIDRPGRIEFDGF